MKKLLLLLIFAVAGKAATIHSLACGMLGNGSANESITFNSCASSAGANGTFILDATTGGYLFNSLNTALGVAASTAPLPSGITIQCASGSKIFTTNGSVQTIFQSQTAVSPIITGCEFIGAGGLIVIANTSNHQTTGLTFSNNNVHDVTSPATGAGLGVFGMLVNSHIDNNFFTNIFTGGFVNSFNGLFGSPTCQNTMNDEERCDHGGVGIGITGYLDTSTINGNTLDKIGGNGISVDLRPGGYSNSFHIPGGGNDQISNNKLSEVFRFGIEMGGFAPPYDPPDNFSIPIAVNMDMFGNFWSNTPYGYWLTDGYSIVINGTNNLRFINNTAANNQPNCYGNYVGTGMEVAANQFTMQGNVISSVRTTCPSDWGVDFAQGNADALSVPTSGITPSLVETNDFLCSGAQQFFGFEGGPWSPGVNGFSPITRIGTYASSACRNPANVAASIITPIFTSPNNQNITSGSGTWNASVKSNISVRQVAFYIDSNSTPSVTQLISDANSGFNFANPSYLYHATINTSGLSNGGHIISAIVTDVSGATSTISQNFTTGGAACTIPTLTIPPATVGVAYTLVVPSSGCGASTWTISPGTLPAGLSASGTGTSTVTISGTPTVVGTSMFSLNYSTAVPLPVTIVVSAQSTCTGGTQNSTNGLFSDPFTESCVAPYWTLYNPTGGATAVVGGSGLVMTVPSTSTGYDNYFNGNQAVVLTQNLQGNADFDIIARFTSQPTTAYQGEGVQAIVDSFNSVRCEALGNGSGTLQGVMYLISGNSNGTTPTPYFQGNFTNGTPIYTRLQRTGNNFSCQLSHDGSTWTVLNTPTLSLNITKIGIALDTGVSGSSAPSWAQTATSFTVAGSPPPPTPGTTPGFPFGNVPYTVTVTGGTCTVGSQFVPAGQNFPLSCTVPGTFTLAAGSVGALSNVSGQEFYTAPASITPQHVSNGCMVGPNDSVFNTRIDSLTVNALNAQWTDTTTMHSGVTAASPVAFGWQSPFARQSVDNSTAGTTMSFDLTTLYNGQVYKLPTTVGYKREGGTFATNEGPVGGLGVFVDHHVLAIDNSTCNFFETYQDRMTSPYTYDVLGSNARSGWAYDSTQHLLPTLTTGGGAPTASGLALGPLTVHLEELQRGVINHAVAATTAIGYIFNTTPLWPATLPNGSSNSFAAPFGARWRVKSTFNPSGLNAYATTMLTGMKRFGGFFTDIGTVNTFLIDSDTSEDPQAIAAMQQLAGLITFANLEFVDESTLMLTAQSSEVPVTSASGQAAQIVFTPTSGSPVSIEVGLQAVVVGMTSPKKSIVANSIAFQLPFFVTGDPRNLGATWSMTFCSLSGTNAPGLCGAVSAGGVYAPPGNIISRGTAGQITLTAVPNADTTQSYSFSFNLIPAMALGGVFVDSGSDSMYTDTSGNVWGPQYLTGVQVESLITPFLNDTGSFDPNGLTAQVNPNNNNLPLWQTGISGLGGNNGSGDIYFDDIFLDNGSYELTLYFYLGSGNNGATSCWGSYTTAQQSIGPLNIVTNGTLQYANWDYGLDSSVYPFMCRRAVTLKVPVVVINHVFNATIGTNIFSYFSPFLNAYSLVPSTAKWLINNNQNLILSPGATTNLTILDYAGKKDPMWTLTAGVGSINPTTGVYTAPSSLAITQPAIIKACSSSQPTLCATTTLVVRGTSFLSF